jgi:hypothetical protein
MKLIVAFLISHHENNKHTDRHGYCQAKYINERKGFMAKQIPYGDFKIVVEHNTVVCGR